MAQTTFEFLVRLEVEDAAPDAVSEIEALLAGQREVLANGEWTRLGDAMAAWLLAFLPQPVSAATVVILAPQAEETTAEEIAPALGGGGGVGSSLGFQKTRPPSRSTPYAPRRAVRKTTVAPRRTAR